MGEFGPRTEFSEFLHSEKYREEHETFDDYCIRYARATAPKEEDFYFLLNTLRNQSILPGGRQQRAVGAPNNTTASNCYVGPTIPDSMEGIMDCLKGGALTLRTGGGMGWDFSTLRPHMDRVHGLGRGAIASGPISFMSMWNAMCGTIISGGSRRGAMMAILRVDHPDIVYFVRSKKDNNSLTNFNISVAITNEFMEALAADGDFDLRFNGVVYQTVKAKDLWSVIMENNWDWAEPGVIFIDRINEYNNLWYCSTIAATNPCSEKTMPPDSTCLLGSMNLVKFLEKDKEGIFSFNFSKFKKEVHAAIKAFDAVIDQARYPLPIQEKNALDSRRIGLGVTGMANTVECLGHLYGTDGYIEWQERILEVMRDEAYLASVGLAKEFGSFPLFEKEKFLKGKFIQTLPKHIRDKISKYGIRNCELISIAPAGTISLCADNVSSGIEPVFSYSSKRKIKLPDGDRVVELRDWAVDNHGVYGRVASMVPPQDHVRVLCSAQKYVDTAISKTCNVKGEIGGKKVDGDEISFSEFKNLYLQAWHGGAKGCTTFNVNGKRMALLHATPEEPAGAACTIDLQTGIKTCDE